MANSYMEQYPILSDQWNYDWGVLLKGIEQVWFETGDDRYWTYIKANIDRFIEPDGSIRTYRADEYNLDKINTGRLLFTLYMQTGEFRYRQALQLLRRQLATHPRTSEGGFWHKKIYPYQMRLDSIYMAGPFYAQYAQTFREPECFDDIVNQILLIEKHARDSKTGLYYHGWDESRMQRWANPHTGCSPHFWSRAMGWYTMAIVDVLDYLPETHPARDRVITIFQRAIAALAAVQDAFTGLWYQVLDQNTRKGNYLESSGSCMFVYAIAKGVRQGYLNVECADIARRGFEGVIQNMIRTDASGLLCLDGTCHGAGLGGEPYRDGSYEYYISEPIMLNDCKGVGAFILAGVEMDRLEDKNR